MHLTHKRAQLRRVLGVCLKVSFYTSAQQPATAKPLDAPVFLGPDVPGATDER